MTTGHSGATETGRRRLTWPHLTSPSAGRSQAVGEVGADELAMSRSRREAFTEAFIAYAGDI